MISSLDKNDLKCNIFSTYDYDGLTINELLCQFFTKINECVNDVNEFNGLVNYLVNEGMKKEVAEKLNTWLENGVFDDILTESVLKGITNKLSKIDKIVLVCGERLEDDTSDSERIQRTINESSMGDIIKLPSEDVIIDKTIILKPSRTYIGSGWGTIIKAKDNANLNEMISLPHSESNYTTTIKNIRLDGNKNNNGANTGLYIGSIVHGLIKEVYATYCKSTGIFIDGVDKFRSNTTDIINCRSYACNGNGLYISPYCEDMHVLQGDYGFNNGEGVYFCCPSSSIRDITCWGNKSNGVFIDSNAVSGQIWNSQIEGNAGNGIFLNAGFWFISGNKIYDNANIPNNYGKFDGIYVNANSTNHIEGVTITGNKIYSGLYSQTGYHRYAVAIDSNHKNFTICGNDMLYQGNGVIDTSKEVIFGVNDTDIYDMELFKKIKEMQ